MGQLLGLRTVIYPAPDLDAAKAWWSDYLDRAPYFDQPFYVGFDVGGYELGLLPDADPTDGALAYWGVAEMDGPYGAALARGAQVLSAPTDVGDGIVTATLRLPTRAILGLIVNPHFAAR